MHVTAGAAHAPVDAVRPAVVLGWVRQLVRPTTLVLVLLQGGLAYGLLADRAPSPMAVLAAVIALAAWYAHAVAVNDLTDVVTDTINLTGTAAARERPLVNGTAGPGQLRWLVGALVVVTVAASAVVDLRLLAAVAAMFALNYAYSVRPVRLAGRGGLAQAVLPVGYVLVPAMYAWALAGRPLATASALITLAGLYLVFAGRLLLKDLRDVEGDRAVGKATFVLRHGLDRTLALAGILIGVGSVIMLGGLSPRVGTGRAAVLLVVLVAAVGVVGWGLRRARTASSVDAQVLWCGLVGRCCSGWLFTAVLALAVGPTVGVGAYAVLVAFAVAMFGLGGRLIHTELATIRSTGR